MSRGMRIEFRFVPFPQEIWKDGIDLTEAEFKLLGYLLYHQVRFGQTIIGLTDDEMLNGTKFRGSRIDAGCGVKGRNNFKAARDKLIEREWIEYEPGQGYRVLLGDDAKEVSETDTDFQNNQQELNKHTLISSETDTPNKEVKKVIEVIDKNPSGRSAPGKVDPRFTQFVEALDSYWKFKNPDLRFSLGKAGGAELNRFLSNHPAMTIEQFRTCLNHRARSDMVHTQDVFRWIGRTQEFFNGPLDQYWKPKQAGKNGNGQISKADERERRIIESGIRAAAARAGSG